MVARSLRHADDFDIGRRCLLSAAQPEVLPNGILTGEILLGEDLVHDRYFCCTADVALFDFTAEQNWNLHRGKEAWADRQYAGIRILSSESRNVRVGRTHRV